MASGITINSNLAAISAQRRLAQNSSALNQAFTRLSSGLRINRAADDAAGLAIAESLNVDARVFNQGIRNVNDAISLTNIADSVLRELTNISTRQIELSEQAANNVYSPAQRSALQAEANALTDEYNRIIATTQFNGNALFAGGGEVIAIQGGYGGGGTLSLSLGKQLIAQTTDPPDPDGSFAEAPAFDYPERFGFNIGDLNGDGFGDLISGGFPGNEFFLQFGNGDGSFTAGSSYDAGVGSFHYSGIADFNHDGAGEVYITYGGAFRIFPGNGNGTFKTPIDYETGGAAIGPVFGDFNNDTFTDIGTANWFDNSYSVLLANSDGTFQAPLVTPIPAIGAPRTTIGDIDGDGYLDAVAFCDVGNEFIVLYGAGNGTFATPVSVFSSGIVACPRTPADFNSDGCDDLLVLSGNSGEDVELFLGGRDRTLSGPTLVMHDTAGGMEFYTGEFNGDGKADIIAGRPDQNATLLYAGNGDGTFAEGTVICSNSSLVSLGDLNGDRVNDLILNHNGEAHVFFANTLPETPSCLVGYVDFSTANSAREALTTLNSQLQRITSELGAIGSFQSRLEVAVNTLSVSRENFLSAKSQIVDADVTEESAQLVKQRILQQAGAAVLAQANTQPQLALTLLRGG
jgi:flagellin